MVLFYNEKPDFATITSLEEACYTLKYGVACFFVPKGAKIMNNLAYTYEKSELINEWQNFYMSPTKNHGMIATLDLSRIAFDGPKQFWWTYESLSKLLSITEREKPYTNLYISLNAFKQVNGQMKRKASQLAQIRNIGVDLDCYKLGIDPADCKEKLFDMIAHSKIPNPNLLINSGNGVQLIYSIQNGAAPTNEIKWLVMYITRELTGQLVHLGADFQTCTLERVFRLPYTLNKKEGYPTKLVTADVWNQREWSLNELMDYVKPYKPLKKRTKLRTVTPLRGFKKGMRTLPQMNMARANDLLNLVELRNGEIENRNILCYDYAFSLALGSDMSRSEIQEAVLQMDSSFTSQQKRNVLRTTVKSAIDGAEAFWRAYEENQYSMHDLDKNLVKPKQTRTIITQQSITADEMEALEVLIGKEEKFRRRYEKRRSEGMQTMEQYNTKRSEAVNNNLEQLRKLKQENPEATHKELALLMNVSTKTIQRLSKKL